MIAMKAISEDSEVHEVTDRDQFVPVASPQLLLSHVLERLDVLEERDRLREERVAALEAENRALKEELATVREEVSLERAHDRQRITRLEIPTSALLPPPQTGTKTAARIEELKARLKRRRGRAAFSELREEMGLSKTQFSKLISHLDKRIFDIQRHPRKTREKVLILRQQIGQ